MKNYCRMGQILFLSATVCFFVSCVQKVPIPAIPEKKNTFQKIVFTEPKYGNTITLISETECEMKWGPRICLATYSREGNKLRMVEPQMGTSEIYYYDIVPEGLYQLSSRQIYLSPEELQKFLVRERGAQLAEQERRSIAREAEQERQQALKKQKKELMEYMLIRREALMQNIHNFLSKGTVFNSTYLSDNFWLLGPEYKNKDPNLPFQITIIGELIPQQLSHDDEYMIFGPTDADPQDMIFGIPAHFKWLGMTEYRWGDKKEYDGMIIGLVEIKNKDSLNPEWRITVKYCHNHFGYMRDWGTKENGSIWNGTQFVGKKKEASINLLASQRTPPSSVSPNKVTAVSQQH